jgi:hypothetical protein
MALTAQQIYDARRLPQNWTVSNNTGATITAYNSITGETLTNYSLSSFNTLISQGALVLNPPATYFTDSAGNVTGLVGPNGVVSPINQSLPNNRIAVLGTSIEQAVSDSQWPNVTAQSLYNAAGIPIANAIMGAPFSVIDNFGIGGDTSGVQAYTLASVQTTNTTGGISFTSGNTNYGQIVTVTGANSGSGSISGYVSGSQYLIGSNTGLTGGTTATLTTLNGAAITTVAGTLTGLTFTLSRIGMINRVAQIIAGGYGWCYVGFPLNDIMNGAGANITTFTVPNMYSIYSQLIQAGIKVIASDGSPTSALATTGANKYTNAYAQVQSAIRSYVASHNGIVLCPTSSAMTNPATGLPFTSPASTLDGIHDNVQGSMKRGQVIAGSMANFIKYQDSLLSNPFDPRNYAINPLGQGSNASGSGGFNAVTVTGAFGPNGWAATVRNTGAGVLSKTTSRIYNTYRQPTAGTRVALTSTAAYDAVNLFVGGYPASGTVGRYNSYNWATLGALSAQTYGARTYATANGAYPVTYTYTLVTPGSLGAVEPNWALYSEGDLILDGSVVWLCQLVPVNGMQFYAECEVETSSLVGGGTVMLLLFTQDTAGNLQQMVAGMFLDLGGSGGPPPTYLPPTLTIRTPIMTLGHLGTQQSFTNSGGSGVITDYLVRYLYASIDIVGGASSSANIDVYRCDIIRAI